MSAARTRRQRRDDPVNREIAAQERRRIAATRARAAQTITEVLATAGYGAARSSRLRKDYAKSVGSGDFIMERDREKLVRFARNLDMLSPVLRPFATQVVTLVVGSGLRPRASGDSPAQRAIALFNAWADDPLRCDLAGRMSFWDYQRFAVREGLIAGDMGVVMTSAGMLQAVESERIDTPPGKYAARRNDGVDRVVDGVEVDDHGRALRYHVASWTASGSGLSTDYKQIDAAYFALVASRQRASQVRGVPLIASALERLAMSDETQVAVDVAIRVAACFAMVVTSAFPGATRDAIKTGTATRQGNGDNPVDESRSMYGGDIGAAVFLNPGEEMKTVQGAQPTVGYLDYHRAVMTIIAASIGFPVEAVLLDNSRANFSVSRLAMIQAQNTADPMREELARQLCHPVFRWFTARAVARGELSGNLDELTAVRWSPPRVRLLDPEKEIRGYLLEIENNLASKADVMEQLGRDFDQVAADRAGERKVEQQLGITPAPMQGAAPPVPTDPPASPDPPPSTGQTPAE